VSQIWAYIHVMICDRSMQYVCVTVQVVRVLDVENIYSNKLNTLTVLSIV